jgi:predicted house-cleaning NTP pyrophosphatase (Maf/HAM1 superfamily)
MITTLISIVNTLAETSVNDYPVNYKITDKAHVFVFYVDDTEPEVELVQVAEFTAGADNEYKVNAITESGFNVELRDTYTAADDRKISIRRIVPTTQEVEYPPGNDFPGSTHERALDKLTAIVQQFNETLARQIGMPLSEDAESMTLPNFISNYYLGLDGDNNLIWKIGTFAPGNDEIKDSHIDWGTGANQVSAEDMPIEDSGTLYTAEDVEAALAEVKSQSDTHEANDGSDHTFIDQDIKSSASPEFAGITIDGLDYTNTPMLPYLEGAGLSISGIGNPAIAALDSTHIAFIDTTLDQLRTYLWNGSVWVLEGAGLDIGGISNPLTLSALDSTHVAFIDQTVAQLRTYVWNGSIWALEGSGFGISGINNPALTTLDSTHIAFIDAALEELRTYVWNGSVWALEGSGFGISGIGVPALTTLDSTHVAFIDDTLEELRTYVWDGSVWALEGAGLDISGITQPAITSINSTHIAFIDATLEELRIYIWDGSVWVLEGPGLSISGISSPVLSALDSMHVAFIDTTLEELRTYKYKYYLVSRSL